MAKLTLSVDGVLGELSNFDEKDARCLATIAQILRSDEIEMRHEDVRVCSSRRARTRRLAAATSSSRTMYTLVGLFRANRKHCGSEAPHRSSELASATSRCSRSSSNHTEDTDPG